VTVVGVALVFDEVDLGVDAIGPHHRNTPLHSLATSVAGGESGKRLGAFA
jgi:hypothetical protein